MWAAPGPWARAHLGACEGSDGAGRRHRAWPPGSGGCPRWAAGPRVGGGARASALASGCGRSALVSSVSGPGASAWSPRQEHGVPRAWGSAWVRRALGAAALKASAAPEARAHVCVCGGCHPRARAVCCSLAPGPPGSQQPGNPTPRGRDCCPDRWARLPQAWQLVGALCRAQARPRCFRCCGKGRPTPGGGRLAPLSLSPSDGWR